MKKEKKVVEIFPDSSWPSLTYPGLDLAFVAHTHTHIHADAVLVDGGRGARDPP